MCVNPVTIRNNSLYVHTHYMHTEYTVPCGKCYDCLSSATTSWMVRCGEQFKKSSQSYFYTLTYDPQYINSYGSLPDGKPRYVFNKRHVQLFLKRLRKSLTNLDVKIKYILTSELGENTHRPHYHAIFFLNKAVNPFVFRNSIRKSWTLGFVRSGDNLGIVRNTAAINYVIKYILKTDEYTNGFLYHLARTVLFKWYRRFRKIFPNIPRPKYGLHYNFDRYDYHPSPEEMLWNNFFDAARKEYRAMIGFHLQSTELGLPTDLSDYSCHTCKLRFADGSFVEVKTPLYYIRKQYYDRLPNFVDGSRTLFRLNSKGLVFKASLIADRLSDMTDDVLTTLKHISHNPSDADIYNGTMLTPDFLSCYIKGQDFTALARNTAIYKIFYKNLVWDGQMTDLDSFKSISDNPYRYALVHYARLHNNSSDIVSHNNFVCDFDSFKSREVSHHPSLIFYREFSVVVDNLMSRLKKEKIKIKQNCLNISRLSRDLVNPKIINF